MIGDLLGVVISFLISFLIRKHAPILAPLAHGIDIYLAAWPALFIWPLVFWREGLYPGYWLSAREELRRTVTGTTFAGLIMMAATFITKTGPQFSRPIIVGSWLISLILIPATRFLVRGLITRAGFAGPRAIILGAGKTAAIVIDRFRHLRPPALRPVAMFDDDPVKIGEAIAGIKVEGTINEASTWASERGIRTAIVAMPGVPRDYLVPLIETQSKVFPRIIVIPDLFGLSAAETDAHDIQGVLALELRRNLLYRHNRVVKRVIDLSLLALSMIVVLPLTALISLAIALESGRPVFFRHERIGQHGKSFMAWKYRTMVKDSEHALEETLQESAELRREWASNQKLKDDPRLTKVGKIVRRLSLDELPQLWNVLRGEMSLVGPRPIVEEEIQKYGDSFDLYTQVLPGLTGLWQVSGRSDLPYRDRVWLDSHYVRNWSIWLDLVILVRTVWVVIAGIGAY
jgi:Undecaprenyl-phosphate galactose phosphotransferase WbaP